MKQKQWTRYYMFYLGLRSSRSRFVRFGLPRAVVSDGVALREHSAYLASSRLLCLSPAFSALQLPLNVSKHSGMPRAKS